MSTPIELGRPVSGDVVELILEDHRRFEHLLRQLRDSTSDREAVRAAFSALHVAHAEAEEKFVYPTLRRKDAIDEHALPWHVTRLGARVEYLFRSERPVTGSDAAAGADPLLDRLIHLYALNRGVLLTPFHNMALMSPATTEEDVDRHTAVFREATAELAGRSS